MENIFLDPSLRLCFENALANNSFETNNLFLGSSSDPFRSHSLLVGDNIGGQREPNSPTQQGAEIPPAKASEVVQQEKLRENVPNDLMGAIPPSGGPRNYIDVTPFLNLSQNEAARKLSIPSSTLSKRWREATVGRKWPFRNIAKIEKEINTLLKNAPNHDPNKLPLHMQDTLARLIRRKQEECRQVYIRL